MSSAPNTTRPTERAAHNAPPMWKRWLLASRPPTLPASVVPVLVGSAAAYAHSAASAAVLFAALVSSLFIQVGTNLANDLFDFKKGADTADRLGPTRVTQAGLLTPAQVKAGMWTSFLIAFLFGLYLVWVGGWPILLIGLTAIACGIWYTAGRWALAYNGLGDLFTFVYFGVVAVLGTFYVHTHTLTVPAAMASLPVSCLVTAILVVNNLRDIETDRKARKRTLAVRFGASATKAEYVGLVVIAYLSAAWLWAFGEFDWAWLPLLTLPMGISLARRVLTEKGRELNPVLAGTGRLHLLFGNLLAIALIAGG